MYKILKIVSGKKLINEFNLITIHSHHANGNNYHSTLVLWSDSINNKMVGASRESLPLASRGGWIIFHFSIVKVHFIYY